MTTTGLPADVCDELAAALRAAGIRQIDVAGTVGVSQGMMSKVLSGARIPNRAVARGLARELGLDDERAGQLIAYCDAHARARNLARRRAVSS